MTKNTIKYSLDQEKEICQQYLNNIKTTKICQENKFSYMKLMAILKRNNVGIRPHIMSPKKSKIDEIKQFILNGKTLKSACKMTGVSKSCAEKHLKRDNFKVPPNGQFIQKYNLNENFFEKIDTPEKAQFLGVLYADGTLSSYNKLISLRLQITDKEYLEKIKNIISSNKNLYFITGKKFIGTTTGKEYLGKDTCCLDITNKKFYEDAIKCGLCPRKTWANLGVPNENILPLGLRKYFILGLFEGDGCISSFDKNQSYSFSIAGSEKICQDILKIMSEELSISGHFRPISTIYNVTFQRIKDIIKIYHWLYDEAPFCMERKHRKFQDVLEVFKKKGYQI